MSCTTKLHTLNETSTCQREFVICGTSQISPWGGSWILDLTVTTISVNQNITQERYDIPVMLDNF